jgi:hypothetical protein
VNAILDPLRQPVQVHLVRVELGVRVDHRNQRFLKGLADAGTGAEAGSKLDKAQKLGVKIIDEAELLRLCGE